MRALNEPLDFPHPTEASLVIIVQFHSLGLIKVRYSIATLSTRAPLICCLPKQNANIPKYTLNSFFFFFLLSQSHFSLGDWQVLAPGLLKVSGSFSELAWRQITCQSKWVAGNHTRTHTKCRHSGTWRRPGEKKLSKTFQTQLMFLSTFQDQTYYLHQGNTCINHGPSPSPKEKCH